MANPGRAIGNMLDTVSSTVLSRVGNVLGSAVGPAGTAVGGAVGQIAGKGVKYVVMAAVAAVIVIILLFFLVILLPILFGFDFAGPDEAGASGLCSNIPSTFNDPTLINRVNNNIEVYRFSANQGNIPWEMLAAVHYRESNNDANAPNMYQFDPPPPLVDVDNFIDASRLAATVLQAKAALGPVGRALRVDMNPANPNDQQSIKDAFWGYNGRAGSHKDFAESIGFDPDTQGYEGSFYVMNNWDEQRVGMQIIGTINGEPVNTTDTRDGAWKVYILLRNATYEGGIITQINEECEPVSTQIPFGCPMAHARAEGNLFNPPAHFGIDMSNLNGLDNDRVRSTHSGTVVFASTTEHPAAGYYVEVENEIYKTRYLHLRADGVLVSMGQNVTRGFILGIQGSTGDSSGPHLHYEVRENGPAVDPTTFVPMENVFFAECTMTMT